MIELKKNFVKKIDGLEFKQLFKDKDLAIYTVVSAKSHWYEVFKRYVHTPDKYHDDFYELYPSNEAFGLWAWSCSNASVVAKVLFEHFNEHQLTKFMLKYAKGTHIRNGEKKPFFNISDEQIEAEIGYMIENTPNSIPVVAN